MMHTDISRIKLNVGNGYILIIAQNIDLDTSPAPDKFETVLINSNGDLIAPNSWYVGQESNTSTVINNLDAIDLSNVDAKAREYAAANP